MDNTSTQLTAMDRARVFDALPTPYVVLDPALVIVEVNESYLASTGRLRPELLGVPLFDAFPPPPDALDASGVPRVQLYLERVRDTQRPETMPLQRYDVTDSVTGALTERYWVVSAVPVLSAHGRTELVVQRAEDVTDFMADREAGRAAIASGEPWRRRVEVVEAELVQLAKTLSTAVEARDVAARQVAALNEVALALTTAASTQDVERIVVGRGLGALGADGGAVITPSAAGGWRVTVNDSLGEHVQITYGELPFDSPLPACWTARTGERLLLPTAVSGIAFDAGMAQVYQDTQRWGWAFLPLAVADERLGSLAISWVGEHHCTPDELEVLDGFAAQCAQALERLRIAAAQQEAAAAVERLSEGLQRSLLTDLPHLDAVELAARYAPATSVAQVGGDWYDAFVVRGDVVHLVIGDVAGHDRDAAITMAQVRNVLRGVAHAITDPPAAVLSALDLALHDLDVATLATAVLATVVAPRDESDTHRLVWTNAGHPPPLLITADGAAQLLTRPADLLLGLQSGTPRSDHSVALTPGARLLLYTDGLVERRGEHLDTGLERLRRAAEVHAGLGLDELCDALLADLAAGAEDDVALLALRVRP